MAELPVPPGDFGGFAGHSRAQALAWSKLTPLERLRWLAQAKRFVARYLGAAARSDAAQAAAAAEDRGG